MFVKTHVEYGLDSFKFAQQIQKTEYWMSAIYIANCEKLHSVRGLYDKKTAPHSNVYLKGCIKSIKSWFTSYQICWTQKNEAWFFILASLLDKGMQPINYNV